MRIDLLFIQLAVVLLPGLIWTQLAATYAMKERPRPAEFVVRAFFFGILTYMVVYFMYGWFGREFSKPLVGDSQQLLHVDFADEILWSSGAALVFSFVWIYGSTHRWMTRFLNLVGAATTHGREDIWDLTFSRLQAEVEYVHVRDLERGITYAGWVRAYSETGKLRELLLRDAIVWDNTGGNHRGSIAVSRAEGQRCTHRVSVPRRTARTCRNTGRRRSWRTVVTTHPGSDSDRPMATVRARITYRLVRGSIATL